MNPIPDQTIVTYQGTWTQPTFTLPGDVLSAVVASLATAGIVVRNSSISSGMVSQALGVPFQVTLQLQVENGIGFTDVSDVEAIVDEAVSEAGSTVQASSTPFVQAPGATSPASTGQPAQQTATAGCNGPNDLAGHFDFSCFISGLTTNGAWVIGIAVVLLGLGTLLIYGPKHRTA